MMISSPNSVGAAHLHRRIAEDFLLGCASNLVMRQPADGVFHHDDGAIHHQAEVDGPQAEQAAGDAEAPHAAEGEGQRQRDGQGHHQAGPQVAQEDEQDGDHQQAALEQVA